MIAILLALILTSPMSLTNTQAEEIRKVEKRLLAPCCYTQSVAEHGSEIAVQMREEVTEMISEGRTEEEIIDHYKNRYGKRILVVPDGLTGRILFSVPVATLILAFLILLICMRNMLSCGRERMAGAEGRAQPTINTTLRAKIEREIGDSF